MHLLITAGPTREPIDDVRFISNRSSGRMGLALAKAAVEAGHTVTLLLGPGPRGDDEPKQPACTTLRFESATDLRGMLHEHFRGCDVLIMAAAVADYRPRRVPGKIERVAGQSLTLTLEPVPDLVAEVAATKRETETGYQQGGQKIIAFALEDPTFLERRAAAKMRRKGVDAIVANPLNSMEADTIRSVLLTASGQRLTPPGDELPKTAFAAWLLEQIDKL
jgi:phosphopantothenoylcysteine decarboxylase / phosphopantothenate---cysteine ligase